MEEMQDFDADGFKLEFEPDVSAEEREHYIKAYPNVDMVLGTRLHCTSCQKHFGAAPSKASTIQMHPVLGTTQCKKCYAFYNSGEFDKGEDGSELYCRWCGQGGEVYCCSKCPYVFCQGCITKNLSSKVITEIENNDNWECFRCVPKTLWNLRARHWALANYLEKKKKIIVRENRGDEEAIHEQMGEDPSTCCTSRSSRRSTSSKRKRIITDDSEYSDDSDKPIKQLKKAKPVEQPVPPTVTVSVGPLPTLGDIVCTPDIMSMFSAPLPDDESTGVTPILKPVKLTKKRKIILKPLKPTDSINHQHRTIVHDLPTHLVETDRQIVTLPTPKAAPVFHTINGYTIDLNNAAKQDTFRLPNGKLIQVKKQPNVSTTTASTSRTQITKTSQLPILPTPPRFTRPPTVTPVVAHQQQQLPALTSFHLTSNNQAPPVTLNQMPQIRHIGYTPATPTTQQLHMQSVHLQQQQQLLNTLQMVPPTTVVQQHPPPSRQPSVPPYLQPSPAALHQLQQIQALASGLNSQNQQQQHSQPAQQTPGPTVRTKGKFPNTPVGRARSQFEGQIFNAQDLCQHIISKLNSLMKSNAYKTASSFRDVKDLHIHLSYLYTYTMDRVRTLQEKSQDDIKRLEKATNAAINAADKRAKYVNDEDDLKIVEQPRTCIEIINSDDENEEPKTAKSSATKKTPAKVMSTTPPPLTQKSTSPPPLRPILISSVSCASAPADDPPAETEPEPEIQDISDDENELPLPPEIVMAGSPAESELNSDAVQNISDEENELPLPPAIETVKINSHFDIENDKKLKQRPHVRIQRIEDINPLGKEKLDQLMATLRPLAEIKETSKNTETLNGELENNKCNDDLVELIEVDDDNDVICWEDIGAAPFSKASDVIDELNEAPTDDKAVEDASTDIETVVQTIDDTDNIILPAAQKDDPTTSVIDDTTADGDDDDGEVILIPPAIEAIDTVVEKTALSLELSSIPSTQEDTNGDIDNGIDPTVLEAINETNNDIDSEVNTTAPALSSELSPEVSSVPVTKEALNGITLDESDESAYKSDETSSEVPLFILPTKSINGTSAEVDGEAVDEFEPQMVESSKDVPSTFLATDTVREITTPEVGEKAIAGSSSKVEDASLDVSSTDVTESITSISVVDDETALKLLETAVDTEASD